MAIILPLVVKNGQIQQAKSDDTLGIGITEVDIVNLNNSGTAAASIGRVVYPTPSGFALARADASATKNAIGLIKDATVAASANGNIQTDGLFVATAAQFDAVTGGQGGLTPGAWYYLSPTAAGGLTSTPPSTANQYVVPIGLAVSSTALDIRIGTDILL